MEALLAGPNRISGSNVAQILRQFGFEVISQRGSHMKLRRTGLDGRREVLTIPAYRQLDTGTCRALLRQASRFIPISQLTPFSIRSSCLKLSLGFNRTRRRHSIFCVPTLFWPWRPA